MDRFDYIREDVEVSIFTDFVFIALYTNLY